MNQVTPIKALKLRSHRLSRRKTFWNKYKLAIIIAAIAIFGLVRLLGGASSFNFVFGGTNLQSDNGRVNVLLLGIGGGNHDGATLTDTIIVAAYDLKSHNVDLISVPRDLWYEPSGAKVNTFYQTGLLQNKGLDFAQDKFGQLLGLKIGYTVRLDFAGFVKAVDQLGGVDVKVENSFDDYEYPIDGKEEDLCGYQETQLDISDDQASKLGIPKGKQQVYLGPDGKIATSSANLDYSCRFEHISFKKGLAHLDGATALKFVRSRHGNNGEGSDFARSKRQQLIIEAVRSKVLTVDTLTDVKKLAALVQTFGDSVSTNIPANSYLEFANLVKKVSSTKTHILDTEGNSPVLIHPDPSSYGGAWVVIPPNNDFSVVRTYIDKILAESLEASSSAYPK